MLNLSRYIYVEIINEMHTFSSLWLFSRVCITVYGSENVILAVTLCLSVFENTPGIVTYIFNVFDSSPLDSEVNIHN